VGVVSRHARRVLGDLTVNGSPYWTDAALLQAAGIPTVVFGPKGEGMHAAGEYVDLGSVASVEDVLIAAVTEFCG